MESPWGRAIKKDWRKFFCKEGKGTATWGNCSLGVALEKRARPGTPYSYTKTREGKEEPQGQKHSVIWGATSQTTSEAATPGGLRNGPHTNSRQGVVLLEGKGEHLLFMEKKGENTASCSKVHDGENWYQRETRGSGKKTRELPQGETISCQKKQPGVLT